MHNIDTIDLSKLPEPRIIDEKEPLEIAEEMKKDLISIMPSLKIVDSDPLSKLIDVFAYREAMLCKRVNDAAGQCLLAFAKESNLDHLAALFNVKRNDSDDQDLKERVLRSLDGQSTCGSISSYAYHVFKSTENSKFSWLKNSINAVDDCNPHSLSEGVVKVSVLFHKELYINTTSKSYNADTEQEVENELAAIRAEKLLEIEKYLEDKRPLTDKIIMDQVDFIDFSIKAKIHIPSGVDSSLVLDAAKESIEKYCYENKKIGRTVWMSGIYAALHAPNVSRVELFEPKTEIFPYPIGSTDAEIIERQNRYVPSCINLEVI